MHDLLQRRSLLGYLTLRVIVPLSLLLLGLLIIGVVVYQQLVASLIFDRDSELGDLAAWDLRLELGEYSEVLHRIAGIPGLSSLTEEVRSAALQDAASNSRDLFDGMALVEADGKSVAFADDNIAHLVAGASRNDFQAASAPIDALIGNVVINPDNGESMVVLGVPVPGATDSAARLLLGYVTVRGSDMIELLAQLTVGGSGYAYLVDRNGRVIYHPDADELGADFSDRSYVQKVKAGEHGGTLWDSPTGERWIVDYTPLAEAGWGIVVKEPRYVAVAPALYYGRLLVGIGVLVIVVVFVLLLTGVRRVAGPIGWLAEQTERLAAGEEVKYTMQSGIMEVDSLGYAFERMAGQLASYRSSLRRYIELITKAQEDERRRIARELHDETVQNLIGVARRIELLQDSVADPRVRIQWTALREMVADTAHGVRQISLDLRPPVLEDLGLVNALYALASSRPADGNVAPDVAFTVEGEPIPLDSELELTLFRIAQEALGNIHKHAVADCAELHLRFDGESVQLTVKDDGIGFELPASFAELVQQGSLGLMGIQERVWAADGRLEIQSRPGFGTHLQATIPVPSSSIQCLEEVVSD